MPSAICVVPQGLDIEGKDSPDQAGDQPAMCTQDLSQGEGCRQGRASRDACARIPAGEELRTESWSSGSWRSTQASLQHHSG